MIHPSRPRKLKPIDRIVAYVPPRPGDEIVAVDSKGAFRFQSVDTFIDWICGSARGGTQVWLSPHSSDWAISVPSLVELGAKVIPSKRRGEFASLAVKLVKLNNQSTNWLGRSASGFVDVPMGLSPESEARATLEALESIEASLQAWWPGVTLGSSIAATAVSCFRQHLKAPIGCDWIISKQLRELCYGGGRIEFYTKPGSVFESNPPIRHLWDLDISGAYATAMAETPIFGEFRGFGGSDMSKEDSSICVAIVDVPSGLPYPPLRVEHHGQIYYPTGLLFGSWTCAEVRAAEKMGCKVVDILSCMQFYTRSEFSDFGKRVIDFRKNSSSPHAIAFAKALSVQLAGAFGSKPSLQRFTVAPSGRYGYRIERCGIYAESRFRPSDREIMSAACSITGRVRSWVSLALHAMHTQSVRPIHVHTDGMSAWGDRSSMLQALVMAEENGGPKINYWKIDALQRLEIWAANQRISKDSNGVERVAAGGISRQLSATEVREQLQGAPDHRAATAWMSGKRTAFGPMNFKEIDRKRSAELQRIKELKERLT